MKKKHISKGKVEKQKSIFDLLEENDESRDKNKDKKSNQKTHN